MPNDDDRLQAPIAPSPVMSIPDGFPADLHAIVEAELRAGNEILEAGHTHPAPPAGAYVKLARVVTTHPHASRGGVLYYLRNNSSYSGEFYDARRFYFVLEPPLPPPPEPDMDAIRAAINYTPPTDREGMVIESRFDASMILDYERWKEGIGYDLQAIATASPEERRRIEHKLLSGGVNGWRDVEALAAIGSPRAHGALKAALKTANPEVRMAVLRYAPKLVSKRIRIAAILAALQTADFYGGLSEALDEVTRTHPPEIIDALFRGTLEHKGDVACHFAAMLFYLHGKAAQPFDWAHRPFFLRFNTTDRVEREAAFAELCERVGVDPALYRSKPE